MLTFKFAAILIIAAAGIFGGLITLRSSFDQSQTANLNMGNAFAGGVFLGAGFLHMLPDGLDNFSSLNLSGDYPYGLLTVALGFILIMFIDKGLSGHDAADKIKDSGRFPAILFLVLAIHSIIAGISLGLEQGFLSGLVILIAIVAHKGSAAFALGLNMINAQCNPALIRKTILFFACMSPLGIILGSLLDGLDGGKNSVLFEAVFDTLAAGTFLYIATLEIIAELFEQNTQKTSKLMMIFMGFALMATIAIWT
jgi:zinc transporter 1/2/3